MVSLLTQAEKNSFAGATVSRWWQLDSIAGDQRVVLSLAANSASQPFVVEHTLGNSGGRVVVWTASADATDSTLPHLPNFLPLVNETVFHLASGQSKWQTYQLVAGQPIIWTSPPNVTVNAVRVLRPDGLEQTDIPIHLVNGRYTLSYDETYVPGCYELRFDPASIPQPVYYSANIDRRELEPAVLSAADIDALKESKYLNGRLTPGALAEAFVIEVSGTEVWRYAALGLLVLLVLETFLTCRAMGLQRGADARDLLVPGQAVSP